MEPSFLPLINSRFMHKPLPQGTKIFLDKSKSYRKGKLLVDIDYYNPSFPMLKDLHALVTALSKGSSDIIGEVNDTEEYALNRKLSSACRAGYNPFYSVAYSMRKELDRNAPISNAFAKLTEIIQEPEVKSILDEYTSGNKKLEIVFLAEAPGTFPIAILYYIGNKYPTYIKEGKYQYRCTTLEFEDSNEDEETALGDRYKLIQLNPRRWLLVDHTSVEATKRMMKRLGKHKYPMVTGDIAVNISSWLTANRESFPTQLGQFVAACILLKKGGTAVLKMFGLNCSATFSILRLAIGVFESVRLFKPSTSRETNSEVYWILGGFKPSLFDPLLDDLFKVMATVEEIVEDTEELNKDVKVKYDKKIPYYDQFLHGENVFDDEFLDRVYRYTNGKFIRTIYLDAMGFKCLRENVDIGMDAWTFQKKMMRTLEPLTVPYVDYWKAKYAPRRIGDLLYDFAKVSPDKK